MKKLISELQDEKTCVQAAERIRDLAGRNQEARRIAESDLPEIIEHTEGQVRFNAVNLVGELKIERAIPELVDMLKDPMTIGGPTSLGIHARLEDDPPGHALAQIGGPAIPFVKPLLNDSNRDLRIRAVLVLVNMNLPSADAVLDDHKLNETDANIRKLIDRRVAEHRSPAKSN